jgi:hypothetical protein
MSYEDYVGLHLNKARVRRQRAVSVLAALLASGGGDLDYGWGDAVAEDAAEAEPIVYEANRERAVARHLRRHTPG